MFIYSCWYIIKYKEYKGIEMDLIGGYLLVFLALFAGNLSLLLGNYDFNKLKMLLISLVSSMITFILLFASISLNAPLSFLVDNLEYLFFAIAAVVFISMLCCIKTDNFRLPLYATLTIGIISTLLLSSQTDLNFFNMFLYFLMVFVIIFVVYQLTKLLHHAKRQYSVIVGEYMALFSILVFIFALTYESTRNIDYTAFTPFLILTPTYQLIYLIIGIIVVLVIGVLINDKGGT